MSWADNDSIIASLGHEPIVMIPISLLGGLSLAVKPRTDSEGLSLPISEQRVVTNQQQWMSVQ